MTIVNLTPHPINMVRDGKIIATFAPEGVVRVSTASKVVGDVMGFPLCSTTFGEVVGLPEPCEGTTYVVSRLVKSAVPNRADCVVPDALVRDTHGSIIGCAGFSL